MLTINKSFQTFKSNENLIKNLIAIQKRFKYFTESDIEHKAIMTGGYPVRPNVPRIRFDPFYDPTDKSKQTSETKKSRKEMISKAMSSYLQNARQYQSFIEEQTAEFENGKRHLANIMGTDVNSMTQKDIDLAIQYLMPSGLFSKRARPQMRPPQDIYPKKKEAQFDTEGRPFSSMFYTGKPNFYETCFKISEYTKKLNDFEDRLIRKGITTPPEDAKLYVKASDWLSYREMRDKFLESFDEQKYDSLIKSLERLLSHPFSKLAKDFIMEYRQEVKSISSQMQIPPLMTDENGRPYMTAKGTRKYCVAEVTVRGNGTGKVDINGKDILYFDFIQDREQVMSPLMFCGLLFKVDIECKTMHEEMTKQWSRDSPPYGSVCGPKGGWRELGTTAQSGAIRYALSLALRSFVDQKMVEKMRLAGLLTRDIRTKERKKWGQEGARRKYTWKKR